MDNKEFSYWMALAHHDGIETKKKNDVVVSCYENRISLSEFLNNNAVYNLINIGWSNSEALSIKNCLKSLDFYNKSFDFLVKNDVEIIPITSDKYPKKIKQNLGRSLSPLVLYYKGNLSLLDKQPTTIINRHAVIKTIKPFIASVISKSKEQNIPIITDNETMFDRYFFEELEKNDISTILFATQGLEYYLTDDYVKRFEVYDDTKSLIISASPAHMRWIQSHFFIRSALVFSLVDYIYVADVLKSDNVWSFLEQLCKYNQSVYCRVPYFQERSDNYELLSLGATMVNDKAELCDKYLNKILK